MALTQSYNELWFHSVPFYGKNPDSIQLKLLPDQELPAEVRVECENRSTNPFELLTECDRGLFYDYSLGTRFLLRAKLTDREGGKLFFYTYFGWSPIKIIEGN